MRADTQAILDRIDRIIDERQPAAENFPVTEAAHAMLTGGRLIECDGCGREINREDHSQDGGFCLSRGRIEAHCDPCLEKDET